MAKRRTEEREELPVVKSFALVKVADGWAVLTIKVQGDRVIDIKSSTPDVRAIAIEKFKTTVAKEYM